MLKVDKWLGIMTSLIPGRDPTKEKFKNWYYIRDKTHISYFAKKSFL